MEAVIEKANKVGTVVEAEIKLPSLWDKAEIKKDQDGIRKSLVKLDMAIHTNAVQCLLFAEKHGDTSMMRRLLVDIVDAKSGYRRQGIIAWMKKFSPMELKGDTINLSGVLPDGNKRPWRIEEANKSPFTTSAEFAERVGRPIYRDTLMSKVNLAIKEFKAAVDNTLDGKPIDATKPFYDGLHVDKMTEFFDTIEAKVVDLSQYRDSTKEVRQATQQLAKAQQDLEQAKVG